MTTVDHSKSNAIIAAVAADMPIGKTPQGISICSMQILPPVENRKNYEVILFDTNRKKIEEIAAPRFAELRRFLAETHHIGLKYTDMILDQTLDFYARMNAADAANRKNESALLSQFSTEHVTYSICRHSEQRHVHFDKSKDRTEPEFFRAVAQNHAIEDPDDCLIFDVCADTLFDAVVIIRNHIEKSLLKAFMPEIK